MSAHAIFDAAPLGALIRTSDGQPRPPARFRKKLAAWEQRNGVGRLVRKDASALCGNHAVPASITLHHGDVASGGVVLMIVHRTYAVTSDLAFDMIEAPETGAVRVLQTWGNRTELLHLARGRAEAESWLRAHRYQGAVLEEVGVDDRPKWPGSEVAVSVLRT